MSVSKGGDILFNIYACYTNKQYTTIGTFGDDTMVMIIHYNPEMALLNHDHLFEIENKL